MLNKEQVLYGLRNLVIGDDEQTRIDDQIEDVSDEMRAEVQRLIDIDNYDDAYKLAIQETMTIIEINPIDCLTWAVMFELGDVDKARDDLMDVGRAIMSMEGNDEQKELVESGIDLAFEMWAMYQDISVM